MSRQRFPALFILIGVVAGTTLSTVFPATVSASDSKISVKVIKGNVGNVIEEQDRLVDQAAVTAQQESIRRLQKLLQKYRNTSHEPVLLAKLAELYQQEGSLRFRIAHGKANQKNAAISLVEYKKTMRESVTSLNSLISRYPDFDDLDMAYFMRAKAYQEIGEKQNAKRDYLTLVQKFPTAPKTVSAYMSLAEFAIEDNRHEEALGYLAHVEKAPDSPQYPFALYKMGWSYYNLKNIPKALSYLERHVAYYHRAPESVKEGDVLSSSDQILRENSLNDMAMFYFEGIERKVSDYSVENALSYFKKQNPGDLLGHMTVRFAKHLRAAGMQDQLNSWKNHLIKNEVARPETIEVVMILFEDEINKRRMDLLGGTAMDFVRICRAAPKVKTFDAYFKAQKMLLDTAEKIQALTIKNKKSDDVKSLTSTLSSLYGAFIDIVNSRDERVPKVHYNLAETLFEIQDYEGATTHYRWVIENWKNQKTFDLKVASIKAISSRYEVLREKKIIPTELKPQALSKSKSDSADPLLEEWVKWIDKHAARYLPDDTFDNFRFEANRALYVQGKYKEAVDRFLTFSENHPESKFAIPSASLVLDTYVAGGDWEKTNEMANRLLEVKAWAKLPFGEKLYAMAADSFYKVAENQHKGGDFKQTLSKSEDCIQQYSKSSRLVDCLLLAGKSAMALGKEEQAEKYFTRLIEDHSSADPAIVALLERAQICEKNYLFEEAASDYRKYLASSAGKKLNEEKSSEIWERVLQLLWYAGASREVLGLVKSIPQCRDSLLELCTRLEAFSYLAKPNSETLKVAIARTIHGKKDQKALWAMVGMKSAELADYRDRILLLKSVAENWDKLDAVSQYALLPELNAAYVHAFSLNRKQIASMAPLKATPRAIKRRIEFIQELEGVATTGMKLPWARLRAELLNEVASLYSEFAESVRNLAPPTGLPEAEKTAYEESMQKVVFPFEEKGSELRRKAFEVASNFGVEDESFERIAIPFFKESPSQAKSLEIDSKLKRAVVFDLELLNRLTKQGAWSRVKAVNVAQMRVTPENKARAIQALWIHHLENKNWPAVAYFLAESQKISERALPKNVITVMKSYTLSAAGARSEAFAELYDERNEFQGAERGALAGSIVALHLSTLGRDKVKKLVQTFEKESSSEILAPMITDRNDAFSIAFAVDWSGAQISEQNRMDLFEEATLASTRAQSNWAKTMVDKFKHERKLASSVRPSGKPKKAGE